MQREIQVVEKIARRIQLRGTTDVSFLKYQGMRAFFCVIVHCFRAFWSSWNQRNTSLKKLTQSLVFRRLLIVNTLLLVSCTSDVVPIDARLTISPEQHSLFITEFVDESGGCVFSDQHFMDIPILLTLTTANSSPIGGAAVTVYTDFSENTYSGRAVLALFDDINGNGVVDIDSELVSGADDDIATVTTAMETGSRRLLLRINLSCAFTAELRAFSGAASSLATIEVSSRSSIILEEGGPS